jgi:hypothetical protein
MLQIKRVYSKIYIIIIKNIFLFIIYSKMFNNDINDTFKYNLEQGKDILTYNQELYNTVKPHLQIIQEGSIIESMTNTNSNSALSPKDKKQIQQIEDIEKTFNKTLSEYNEVYKQYSQDILKRKNQLNDISSYLGKNVRNSSGDIYYVNKFGNYYWYSSDAWNNGNPEGCPSDYEQLNGDIPSEMVAGANMNVNTPCEAAGQVIKNKDNGDTSWVDIKGKKHSFPSGIKMSNSCAKMNIMELSSDTYNAIPTGNSMSSVDPCLTLDVNPTTWKKLNELNVKLKSQSADMIKEVNNLSTQDQSINNELIRSKNKMNNYIQKINDNNKILIENKRMINNVEGEQNDSELRMTSNYYFLFIWIIFMALIVSLSMATYVSDSRKISAISYMIIALFVLIFVVYLYNKVIINSNSITII